MFWIIALVAFLIAGVVLISYYIADRKNTEYPPTWFLFSSVVTACFFFVFCILGIVETSINFDEFDARKEIKGSETWAGHPLWTGFNRHEARCTAEKIDEGKFEIISCEGD